jgi:hypothetical protein
MYFVNSEFCLLHPFCVKPDARRKEVATHQIPLGIIWGKIFRHTKSCLQFSEKPQVLTVPTVSLVLMAFYLCLGNRTPQISSPPKTLEAGGELPLICALTGL